jgi:hypothetical protein
MTTRLHTVNAVATGPTGRPAAELPAARHRGHLPPSHIPHSASCRQPASHALPARPPTARRDMGKSRWVTGVAWKKGILPPAAAPAPSRACCSSRATTYNHTPGQPLPSRGVGTAIMAGVSMMTRLHFLFWHFCEMPTSALPPARSQEFVPACLGLGVHWAAPTVGADLTSASVLRVLHYCLAHAQSSFSGLRRRR